MKTIPFETYFDRAITLPQSHNDNQPQRRGLAYRAPRSRARAIAPPPRDATRAHPPVPEISAWLAALVMALGLIVIWGWLCLV